jgi:oxygen-independent coproporphyrinogen-3 oxidase
MNDIRWATETYLAPGKWLQSVENDGCGISQKTKLSQTDIQNEAIMMGLRLSEGITLPPTLLNKINALSDHGLLESYDGKTRATSQGRLLLNAVIRELLT